MRDVTFVWEGPFGTSENIPSMFIGAVGLYLIEYHSEILYIGKSEDQGGFKRVKDHFRAGKDRIGRCICNGRDENEVYIRIGSLPVGQNRALIADTENLLIYKLQPPCNIMLKDKYNGGYLHIINEGDIPTSLPKDIVIFVD